MIYYIIAILVFAMDQASKWWVVHHMKLYESHAVLGDFFQITSSRNRGAAFSILQGQRWFFIVITIVVVIGIIWYMRKVIRAERRLMSVALGILLGGAIGNFYDRAIHGEVVDFLSLRFQFSLFGKAVDYSFAIFNLADSAITISVVLILLETLLRWLKERRGTLDETSGD